MVVYTEAVILNKQNILQFKKDAEFYYKLSQSSQHKGNMADAVFYLKKAAFSTNDVGYTVELAKTLSQVSQFDQSNLIYLKLLAVGKKEDKCCFGLSQNLYYQSNLEHSLYYLNLYMEKYSDFYFDENDDDEYIEIIEEGDMYEDYSLVYPIEKQDMSDIINEARLLMKQGKFEIASEILEKVPKGNYDYLFALNNIALCCFFLNDFTGTKEYSDKVLGIDKNNIFALCNLAAMYNYIEDSENTAVYLKRFLAVETEDISDLFKIATTLCELKEHSLALKYLNTILNQKPYDTNIMFLSALAYYNNKNPAMAIDIFLQLNKLNEKDYAVKYYLKLIRQTIKEKDAENGFFQPLDYICQVPYGEMLSRIKKLKGITISDIKKMSDDDEFYELCDWSYTLSDGKLQKLLTERLSSVLSKKTEEFLREKLIDPLITTAIKRIIIEKFIIKSVPPPYDISLDYKIKRLNPQTVIANKGKKMFYNAYALAYSTFMMFFPAEEETQLLNSYNQVLKAAEDNDIFKDKKSIAAVIAYKSKKEKIAKAKKNIINLFNADEKTVGNYLKVINNINKKKGIK